MSVSFKLEVKISFDVKFRQAAHLVKMGSLVLFLFVLFVSTRQLDAFCGGRKLNGDLARSSVRAAEFIRSKVLDKNTFMRGHHLGAALSSLRLTGFSIDMLSRVDKEKLQNDIKTRNMSEVTPGEAGYYILGALGTCQDPKDYARLVKRLKDGIPEYPVVGFDHPFPYGLAILGLCISGEGREFYPSYADKLVPLIKKSVHLTHAGDTMSMLTLALSCIYKDESLKNNQTIKTTLKQAANTLVNSQKKDGSFGNNSITTALSVQALLTMNVDPNQWNCKKTMKFMLSKQASDGSFVHHYLMSVVQVIPALIGAIPEDIKHIQCPVSPTDKQVAKIQVCVRLEFLTTTTNGTLRKAPPPVHLTVDEGTNAHTILLLAAKVDPCYKITTLKGAYGHSVTSICGVHRDKPNKKYWMIYSGPNKSAGTGIDSFRPKNGTCAIFKYRKLNF